MLTWPAVMRLNPKHKPSTVGIYEGAAVITNQWGLPYNTLCQPLTKNYDTRLNLEFCECVCVCVCAG